jgi:ABC-type bacteriocin/lantibiotic exporter with double-glycine peptidase domain
MTFQKLSLTASAVMSLAGLAISYSCYAFGIYRVWSGAITYGTMTMFLSLSSSLTSTLNQLISLIPTAVGISVAAGRLIEIWDMPKESFAGSDETDRFLQENQAEGICLTVEDMTYGYHGGSLVFEHTDFTAKPHEIVALVGPSGEGKTTLLRILLALLRPRSGRAEVQGALTGEVLPLTPATRRLFSYVPQGNTMFSGTIADNMRSVKEDASDEEIIAALQMAMAWEFVEKLPDTIYHPIGERGKGFSEGQAQRLSIARALLRKSPILLLDEATSALDADTEAALLQNIAADDRPRACIVTTHRRAVLHICDRVYEIRDRQCVISSSH